MIKAIIFDMGNVIVDHDKGIALEKLSRITGRPKEEIAKAIFDSGLEREFEHGRLTPEEFHSKVMAIIKAGLDYEEFATIWGNIFSINPQGAEVVRKLKGKYTLVLLSNTNEMHWKREMVGIPEIDMVEKKVLSYKLGVMKPDEKIYRAAIEAAGCRPEECVYIEDLKEYVDAAARLGIHVIHFTPATDMKAELERLGVRF